MTQQSATPVPGDLMLLSGLQCARHLCSAYPYMHKKLVFKKKANELCLCLMHSLQVKWEVTLLLRLKSKCLIKEKIILKAHSFTEYPSLERGMPGMSRASREASVCTEKLQQRQPLSPRSFSFPKVPEWDS